MLPEEAKGENNKNKPQQQSSTNNFTQGSATVHSSDNQQSFQNLRHGAVVLAAIEEVKEGQLAQQPWQRQILTDQSNEISIGNRTAEDLVGDILVSDPDAEEELDQMLSKRIAAMQLQEDSSEVAALMMQGEAQHLDGQQLMLRQHMHVMEQKHVDLKATDERNKIPPQSETMMVLSPSRILSSSGRASDTTGNNQNHQPGSENPFEVVESGANETLQLQIEGDQNKDIKRDCNDDMSSGLTQAEYQMSPQRTVSCQIIDAQNYINDGSMSNNHLDLVKQQRSNSMGEVVSKPQPQNVQSSSVEEENKHPQKKKPVVKKRLILPKISLFQKSSETQQQSSQQTQQQTVALNQCNEKSSSACHTNDKDVASGSATAVVSSTTPEKKQSKDKQTEVTKDNGNNGKQGGGNKKGGIMSKLFPKKKDKVSPLKEENSAITNAVPPEAATSTSSQQNAAANQGSGTASTGSTSKDHNTAPKQTNKSSGGFQSRIMNLFTKKSKTKEKEKEKQAAIEKQDEVSETANPGPNIEEQKNDVVVVLESDPLPAPVSSLDQGFRSNISDQYQIDIAQHEDDQQQVDDEPATASEEDFDSEDTNDEIYSAHEGVDFRPTGSGTNEQFIFGATHQQHHQLGSQNISPGLPFGGGRQSFPTSESSDSRQANDGGSTPSIGSFEDQQSNGRCYSPRQRSHSAIPDGEELEFQFSGGVTLPVQQPTMRNQSPFERSPQYCEPELKSHQPFRHSAGFAVGFEALSSGGARTTAAGSQPFGNAGAGGSDRLPFAVSMGSDEHQNLMMYNMNHHHTNRQSVFVPTSSMAMMQHNQQDGVYGFEKRNPRSLSGSVYNQSGRTSCFASINSNSQHGPNFMMYSGAASGGAVGRFSDNTTDQQQYYHPMYQQQQHFQQPLDQQAPQMRISEPFTPSQQAPPAMSGSGFFGTNTTSHHKPSYSLGSIQMHSSSTGQQLNQPYEMMPQSHQGAAETSETSQLGNDQLQTLNLAYNLIYNRPSAPPYHNHRQNHYQHQSNYHHNQSQASYQQPRYYGGGHNQATSTTSGGGSVRGPSSSANSSHNGGAPSRGNSGFMMSTMPNRKTAGGQGQSQGQKARNSNCSNHTATHSQCSSAANSQKPPTSKKRGRGGRGRNKAQLRSSSEKQSMLSGSATADNDTDSKLGAQGDYGKQDIQSHYEHHSGSMQGGKNGAASNSQKDGCGSMAALLRCICCSRGLQSCLLELQVHQYEDLPLDQKVRSLIQIDQQLQHFMPMDNKQMKSVCAANSLNSQTSHNNARAGIEGRLKDDIWHECCLCCTQVRQTLMSEMFGHVSELCRDQLCSKFIQVQLSRCQSTDAAVIDAFYEEICRDEERLFNVDSAASASEEINLVQNDENELEATTQEAQPSLMKNVFGNYVIQLIFEKGSSERIEQFYSIMLRQIERLSFDQFGCRIIQKALVWLSLEKKREIISKFDSKLLVDMMFSEEGNYIVQCIILNLPISEIQFIIPLVQNQVLLLCKDKRGCRVIQRMLEKFPRSDIDQQIIQQIIAAANELTPQQYGNYVITHILQNGLEGEKIQIIDAIIDNIVKFSLYQLGSNVVENCLKGAPESHRDRILEKIIEIPIAQVYSSHHEMHHQVSLANLLENQFGNYVIQHTFNLSNSQRKLILFNKIEQCANLGFVDRTNTYAKHVYCLIHSHFNSIAASSTPTSGASCNSSHTKTKADQQAVMPVGSQVEETKQVTSNMSSSGGKQGNRNKGAKSTASNSAANPTDTTTAQSNSGGTATKDSNTSIKQRKSNISQKTSSSAQNNQQRQDNLVAQNKAKQAQQTSNKNSKKTLQQQNSADGSKRKATAKISAGKDEAVVIGDAEDSEGDEAGDDMRADNEDCGDEKTGVQATKKRRRRKRRRGNAKKHNQMLCQEDILEKLSDSSREEYLQQMAPSPLLQTRSVSQSVFVSDSNSNLTAVTCTRQSSIMSTKPAAKPQKSTPKDQNQAASVVSSVVAAHQTGAQEDDGDQRTD